MTWCTWGKSRPLAATSDATRTPLSLDVNLHIPHAQITDQVQLQWICWYTCICTSANIDSTGTYCRIDNKIFVLKS